MSILPIFSFCEPYVTHVTTRQQAVGHNQKIDYGVILQLRQWSLKF